MQEADNENRVLVFGTDGCETVYVLLSGLL